MARKSIYCLVLAALLMAAAPEARATFHLWTISEVYTNADGTIQFVELSLPNAFDDERFLSGHTLTATQGGTVHTFTFPSDLGRRPIVGDHLLIATSGFAAKPGVPAPDYTLPSGFLFTSGAMTLNFAGVDSVSISNPPTNGTDSLNYPGGTVAANSPTNFGGASGSVTVSSPIADPLPDVPKGNVTVELQTVASGLVSPLGIAVPDDHSGRLFIYDQAGKVTTLLGGVAQATPLIDVAARLVPLGISGPGSYDERGLLGLAMHPDFAHHPKVYTYTSEPVAGSADFGNIAPTQDHQNVIAEWTMMGNDPNAAAVDPASRREILRIDQPAFNHNAGTLRFGPDGLLYFVLGDGGTGDDQGPGHVAGGNAQDKDNIYGKVLRIDIDKAAGNLSANGQYSIPPGNPFASGGGLGEIFAFGFRNPYAFSFDPANFTAAGFRIYLGDAGQNAIEEIDLLTPADAGANYGWPYKEGTFAFDNNGSGSGFVTATPPAPIPPGLIDPIAEYDHNDGVVVIGGAVYRGTELPALAGHYIFGDFGRSFSSPSGRLFYLNDSGAINELRIGSGDRPLGLWLKGFGQGPDGELYVCGSQKIGPSGSTGVVMRLVDPTTVPVELSRFEIE